jgi:hypothetical protein
MMSPPGPVPLAMGLKNQIELNLGTVSSPVSARFFAASKISLICLITGGSSASIFAAICGSRMPLRP